MGVPQGNGVVIRWRSGWRSGWQRGDRVGDYGVYFTGADSLFLVGAIPLGLPWLWVAQIVRVLG
jgi:hypothetical protein